MPLSAMLLTILIMSMKITLVSFLVLRDIAVLTVLSVLVLPVHTPLMKAVLSVLFVLVVPSMMLQQLSLALLVPLTTILTEKVTLAAKTVVLLDIIFLTNSVLSALQPMLAQVTLQLSLVNMETYGLMKALHLA